MKKIGILLLATILGLTYTSCKKDKLISYGDLTMNAIKSREAKFTEQPIVAMNANSSAVLKNGAVVIFKTNAGNYGKLQVVAVEQGQITFNLKVYKAADGTELVSKVSAVMTATNWWDLDVGMPLASNASDLDYNNVPNGSEIGLIPKGGAVFMLYSN